MSTMTQTPTISWGDNQGNPDGANVAPDVASIIASNTNPNAEPNVGKTAKTKEGKKQWMKISTQRDFKQSHTAGMTFRASDRDYEVRADGSWRRKG